MLVAFSISITAAPVMAWDSDPDPFPTSFTGTEITDSFNDIYDNAAEKADVLEKTNTTAYTPTADYHPATKKYVDDNGGGGTSTWLGLTDTPSSFTSNYWVKVNSAGTALELVTAPTGTGDMLSTNNLSDVASSTTSATNLGLGTGNSPTFTGLHITGTANMDTIAEHTTDAGVTIDGVVLKDGGITSQGNDGDHGITLTNNTVANSGADGMLSQNSDTLQFYNGGSWNDVALMGETTASFVPVSTLNAPTYDVVQDMINLVGSAGKFTGGVITDDGDGTITVSAGSGVIRATDSDTASVYMFDWAASTALTLVDNSANYIYVTYNAGTPILASSTTMPTDHNTNVLLGMSYRDGTEIHTVNAGQVVANSFSKMFFKDIETNGKYQHSTGMAVTEVGTRNLAVTSGTYYAGITKQTTPALDTSASGTFIYVYRDGSGGYTEVASQTAIDNSHYDDGSGTLATLTDGGWGGDNAYGVHWIFLDVDGHMYVVYGVGDYTLQEAQAAQKPSNIPGVLVHAGGAIAKVIIQKDDSSFTSLQSLLHTYIPPSGVADHNNLGNIQGGTADEYYHITSAQHDTIAASNTNAMQFTNEDLGTLNSGSAKTLKVLTDTEWTAGEMQCDGTTITGLEFTIEHAATPDGTYTSYGTVTAEGAITVSGWADVTAGTWIRARVSSVSTGDAATCWLPFTLTNN